MQVHLGREKVQNCNVLGWERLMELPPKVHARNGWLHFPAQAVIVRGKFLIKEMNHDGRNGRTTAIASSSAPSLRRTRRWPFSLCPRASPSVRYRLSHARKCGGGRGRRPRCMDAMAVHQSDRG